MMDHFILRYRSFLKNNCRVCIDLDFDFDSGHGVCAGEDHCHGKLGPLHVQQVSTGFQSQCYWHWLRPKWEQCWHWLRPRRKRFSHNREALLLDELTGGIEERWVNIVMPHEHQPHHLDPYHQVGGGQHWGSWAGPPVDRQPCHLDLVRPVKIYKKKNL